VSQKEEENFRTECLKGKGFVGWKVVASYLISPDEKRVSLT
jgi:hypothetical protein